VGFAGPASFLRRAQATRASVGRSVATLVPLPSCVLAGRVTCFLPLRVCVDVMLFSQSPLRLPLTPRRIISLSPLRAFLYLSNLLFSFFHEPNRYNGIMKAFEFLSSSRWTLVFVCAESLHFERDSVSTPCCSFFFLPTRDNRLCSLST